MVPRWVSRNKWTIILGALLIISLAILVSVTREHWLSKNVLVFFQDWSLALGVGATVFLAIVALATLLEGRISRIKSDKLDSLGRISNWVLGIQKAQIADEENPLSMDLGVLKVRIEPYIIESDNIVSEVAILDPTNKQLVEEVNEVINNLDKIWKSVISLETAKREQGIILTKPMNEIIKGKERLDISIRQVVTSIAQLRAKLLSEK